MRIDQLRDLDWRGADRRRRQQMGSAGKSGNVHASYLRHVCEWRILDRSDDYRNAARCQRDTDTRGIADSHRWRDGSVAISRWQADGSQSMGDVVPSMSARNDCVA